MLTSRFSRDMRLLSIALSLFATISHASATYNKAVEWTPCDFEAEAGLPVECGNLTVPLDYTSPDDLETLVLQLVRIPTASKTKKGSVLLNFGGPGEEGRLTLASTAFLMQTLTGGDYDLISFDPRGVQTTMPFSCYETPAERDAVAATIKGVPGKASDVAIGRNWAVANVLASDCSANKRAKRQGSLMSTAFAARDLMQIVDAVEEDGLLRYYGLSYGSTLGATVAAMFPDRIDRLVLDGVQNAIDYHHGADIEMFTDSDACFSGVFTGCVDNPDKCPLTTSFPNATALDLEKMTYDLIESLKYRPIPILNFIIDYELIQGVISESLYDPATWPFLTTAFNALLTGNLTSLAGALIPPTGSETPTNETEPAEDPVSAGNAFKEATIGIRCADKNTRYSSLKEILPTIEKLHAKSRLLGDLTTYAVMQCAQWPIDAVERYEGDFHAETRHPALLVGNTYDNLTPLISARNISESLVGSTVLQHDGYGHTSLAQPSLCTVNVLREYFGNGTLPEEGAVCDVDIPLFGDGKWDVVYELMGLNTGKGKRQEAVEGGRSLTRRWSLRNSYTR